MPGSTTASAYLRHTQELSFIGMPVSVEHCQHSQYMGHPWPTRYTHKKITGAKTTAQLRGSHCIALMHTQCRSFAQHRACPTMGSQQNTRHAAHSPAGLVHSHAAQAALQHLNQKLLVAYLPTSQTLGTHSFVMSTAIPSSIASRWEGVVACDPFTALAADRHHSQIQQ